MNSGEALRRPWLGMLCIMGGLLASPVMAAPTLVAVEPVQKQQWRQTVPLYGTLTSPRDAELTPRIAGLVEKTHVDAGDRVDQGDTLITLDVTLARLSLAETRAAVAQAKAQLNEAERRKTELSALSGTGAVSETEVKARASAVQVAEADLARQRAAVAHQREVVDRHVLVAPFDGVVRERLVEPGEYISSATPAVALVRTERLRLDVRAPQQYYRTIQPGMTVTVRPDAFPERRFKAKVDVTVPASDPAARSFLVRMYLDNSDGDLTPGMSARADFEIASRDEVLVAPRDALVRQPGGGTRMWVVSEGDDGDLIAHKRQVSLGRTGNGLVEVVSGLSADERVVVRGNEGLSAGEAVRLHGGDPPGEPAVTQ